MDADERRSEEIAAGTIGYAYLGADAVGSRFSEDGDNHTMAGESLDPRPSAFICG
jgi:hypothetical protein